MTDETNDKPTGDGNPDGQLNDRSDGDETSGQGQDNGHRAEHERSGTLEKIFTVLSVVLLLGLTGFLLFESTQENAPPAFEINLTEPRRQGDFIAIVVAVQNSGDDTAKAVQVRGEAPGADGKPAEADATLDWLPGKSKRRVTLLFPTDAKVDQVNVNIVGYEEP